MPSVDHSIYINVGEVLSSLHQFGEPLLPPHLVDPRHLLYCDSAAPLRCVGCNGAVAARKGLIATGACEECYRNLMRVAIAEGNQVSLEALYCELLAVIDADEGADASTFLDPETVELYEQNTDRQQRAG